MSHILVDLDGTLAHYDYFRGVDHVGEPIMPMVTRVLDWLNSGKDVRIFTARASRADCIPAVVEWCKKHLGREIPVTNQKDFESWLIFDDRAIPVEYNTGKLLVDKIQHME